jgi:transposase-like protein
MSIFPLADVLTQSIKHTHDEELLNDDAVSVQWYRCKLCGRTRREEVNKEVWH